MTTQPEPKRSPGRPRSLPIDEQRQRILLAARNLFAEHDFHGTSIEAVAKEAGLSRRLVYELFGTKEDLFLAVTNDAVRVIIEGLQPQFDPAHPPTPREFTRAHVAALFAFIEREPEVSAVLRIVEYGVVGPARSEVLAGRRSIEDGLAQLYLLGTGELTPITPQAARLLSVVSLAFVEAVGYRQISEPEWDVEETIDFLTDYIIGGIDRLSRSHRLDSFSPDDD